MQLAAQIFLMKEKIKGIGKDEVFVVSWIQGWISITFKAKTSSVMAVVFYSTLQYVFEVFNSSVDIKTMLNKHFASFMEWPIIIQ